MEKEFSNVIFHYEKQDEELINDMNNIIDEKAAAIYSFFNDIDRVKVNITIVPTKKEFDVLFRKLKGFDVDDELPKWLVGWSAPNLNIYMVSIHDYQNTTHAFPKEKYEENYQRYIKTSVHEYVHYVNRMFCNLHNCPFTIQYLSEGIADYLSGIERKRNFSYKIEDLLETNNCYDGWYKATKYFIENYSHEFILELVKDYDKAKECLIKDFDKIKKYYKEMEDK